MARGSIIPVEGKNGITYAIRYRDQNGKRHYETIGPRKIDAERALTQRLGKVDKGEFRAVKNITFRELAEKWLELKEPEVRPKVYASYKPRVERLVNEFGNQKVKTISPEAVERYLSKLLREELAPATIGRTITILKTIFEKGTQWDYLSLNPARHVKKPKLPKKEMEFLSPGDLSRLIETADEIHRTLMMTACYTGMRQSELLALRWGDIDFENGKIYVRRVLQQGCFFDPKTEQSKRAVVIPPVLIEALKVHQARQAVELDENPHELVFTTNKGTPIASRNLAQRIFEPALKRAGLRKVGFHALRHSYVSLLLNQGESIKFISRQVGHASAKMTLDIYSHLIEGTEEQAMARLERVLASH